MPVVVAQGVIFERWQQWDRSLVGSKGKGCLLAEHRESEETERADSSSLMRYVISKTGGSIYGRKGKMVQRKKELRLPFKR